jgi:hypothetical protein
MEIDYFKTYDSLASKIGYSNATKSFVAFLNWWQGKPGLQHRASLKSVDIQNSSKRYQVTICLLRIQIPQKGCGAVLGTIYKLHYLSSSCPWGLSRHLDPRVSVLIYDIRALAAEKNRRSGEIWNFAMTNFGVNQL